MKLIKPKPINPGDQTRTEVEHIEDIGFNIHKITNRPRPKDPRRILILASFSEFGCETVGALYCIPRILREHPGHYVIVMGWYGREYFYRHLVDEFWEVKEEHQWLREYSRAFHHESKNLKKLEQEVSAYGRVMTSVHVGKYAIAHKCRNCKKMWFGDDGIKCEKCGSEDIMRSLFSDVTNAKKEVLNLPMPSDEKIEQAKKYLGKNPVAVFARGRKCYGRNLQPEFYVKLIEMLEGMGYTPVWLGEKVTTQSCPVDRIVDLTRQEEARDLELTYAIVSQCKFTVQFWTASTRLAGMTGVPYLLFESPDQIWGNGQEGYRRNLCDKGPSKLAVCHFKNVYNDNDEGVAVAKRCIEEMMDGNYEDVFGMVDTEVVAQKMREDNKTRIGG